MSLLKGSRVEISRILLEKGARGERGDCFGMLARVYIRDDNTGVLFKRQQYSLSYNYKKKCFDPEITATNTELQPAKTWKIYFICDDEINDIKNNY
jgi:hypothetical protein